MVFSTVMSTVATAAAAAPESEPTPPEPVGLMSDVRSDIAQPREPASAFISAAPDGLEDLGEGVPPCSNLLCTTGTATTRSQRPGVPDRDADASNSSSNAGGMVATAGIVKTDVRARDTVPRSQRKSVSFRVGTKTVASKASEGQHWPGQQHAPHDDRGSANSTSDVERSVAGKAEGTTVMDRVAGVAPVSPDVAATTSSSSDSSVCCCAKAPSKVRHTSFSPKSVWVRVCCLGYFCSCPLCMLVCVTHRNSTSSM